jgi:hypothetical protein
MYYLDVLDGVEDEADPAEPPPGLLCPPPPPWLSAGADAGALWGGADGGAL